MSTLSTPIPKREMIRQRLHLPDHVRVDFRVGHEQRIGFPGRRHDGLRRGLRGQAQLGPGPRNDGAGQVQVRKYRIGDSNQ